MTWCLSAIVTIALAPAVAPHQNPTRDPVTVGTGVVIGTVTDQRTGLPIGGALVKISGTTRPAEAQVRTDGEGQFVFSRIAAGRYSIGASRSRYFDGQFGQRSPLGPGAPLSLAEGERRAGLIIPLGKIAAITGTVRDEAGEPVVRIEVRAYVREYRGGRPHFAESGSATTDDRGIYRLAPLRPGDFLVGVPVSRPGGLAEDDGRDASTMPRDGGAVSQLPADGNGRAQVFPAAYFPSGLAARYATPVSLDFGDRRRDVDLQVRPAPAFRLAGSIQLPPDVKRSARVYLTTADEDQFDGSKIGSVAVSDGGAFSIGGIPPGQYVLRLDTPGAWASEVISVTDTDVLDIRLLARDPLRVSGRIAFDGGQLDPSAEVIEQLEFAIERADGMPIVNKPSFSVDRSGRSFVITGLMPGRYLIRSARDMQDWFVDSIMHQGRDVSKTAFDVASTDVSGLTATFTSRAASVTGTVTGTADTSSVAVFLFPQDQQRWVDFGSGRRSFIAAELRNGVFDFRNVPPGSYVAVALVADTTAVWQQPSFLEPASRVGTPVRVTAGTTSQVDLRVVGIR